MQSNKTGGPRARTRPPRLQPTRTQGFSLEISRRAKTLEKSLSSSLRCARVGSRHAWEVPTLLWRLRKVLTLLTGSLSSLSISFEIEMDSFGISDTSSRGRRCDYRRYRHKLNEADIHRELAVVAVTVLNAMFTFELQWMEGKPEDNWWMVTKWYQYDCIIDIGLNSRVATWASLVRLERHC